MSKFPPPPEIATLRSQRQIEQRSELVSLSVYGEGVKG